ncbi:DIE2/ALG10 family-domain-containing protein [Scenedesmus sp. NREL 46B-D3]|nr:DIE2/ALG10 family-domain-containing protein [Scenedesmus sp. NREL 46B-D3]
MTQLYCRGDLLTWNSKVTTFPGLYVIGAAYAWASKLLLGWTGVGLDVTCSGPFLRSVNALLAVATIQVAYAVSMQLQQQRSSSGSSHSSHSNSSNSSSSSSRLQQLHWGSTGVSLVVGLLPTQLFFAFLFYTDVPSLLFLLLTELLLLRHSTYAAAAAGAAAIGMRQTNAVWVTFLTGAAMLQDVLAHPAAPASKAKAKYAAHSKCSQQQQQQQQQQGGVVSMLSELRALLCSTWRLRVALLQAYCLLLVLPVVFAAFVLWNGGITLGDRDAHAPSLHLMQPLYFALFSLVSAGPLLLQPAVAARVRGALAAAPLLCVLCMLCAGAAAAVAVKRYSLVHPYLLADNRHYTFYLWRRVFARSELVRLAAVPAYVAGWALLLAGLSAAGRHWLWSAAFSASCCVTLVPAWLVEFRYFSTAFALAVLHLPVPPVRLSLLVVAGYCCVNAVTLWVFARRPYTWEDGVWLASCATVTI